MIVWETLYPGERATELQAVAHPERLRDVGVACATPRGPDNPPPKQKFPCLFSRLLGVRQKTPITGGAFFGRMFTGVRLRESA
jgi:hypothetical protein